MVIVPISITQDWSWKQTLFLQFYNRVEENTIINLSSPLFYCPSHSSSHHSLSILLATSSRKIYASLIHVWELSPHLLQLSFACVSCSLFFVVVQWDLGLGGCLFGFGLVWLTKNFILKRFFRKKLLVKPKGSSHLYTSIPTLQIHSTPLPHWFAPFLSFPFNICSLDDLTIPESLLLYLHAYPRTSHHLLQYRKLQTSSRSFANVLPTFLYYYSNFINFIVTQDQS